MTVAISTDTILAELVMQFPMLRETCDLEAVWAAARSIGWHPQFYYAQGPAPEDSVNRGFFDGFGHSEMSQERDDFVGFVEALYKAVKVWSLNAGR